MSDKIEQYSWDDFGLENPKVIYNSYNEVAEKNWKEQKLMMRKMNEKDQERQGEFFNLLKDKKTLLSKIESKKTECSARFQRQIIRDRHSFKEEYQELLRIYHNELSGR